MPSFEARQHRLYIIGTGKQCLPAFPGPPIVVGFSYSTNFFSDATNPQGLRSFPCGSLDQGENQGVK